VQGGDETAASAVRQRAEAGEAEAQNTLAVYYTNRSEPDLVEAERWAKLALAQGYGGAHETLGVAMLGQGRLEEAMVALREAMEAEPDSATVHMNLGNVLIRLDKPAEAVSPLRRAIELDPELARAHGHLGFALAMQGKTGEAIPCFRRAIELDPGDDKARDHLRKALMNEDQPEEVVELCRQAVALAPEDAEVHLKLGNVLAMQDRHEEAIASYRRAVELDPDHAEAWMGLGMCRYGKGEWNESIPPLRKAVELAPENARAWAALGAVLSDCGQRKEAVRVLRKAVELDPAYAYPLNSLGITLCKLKDWDGAIAALEKAHKIEPADRDCVGRLAKANAEAGNIDRCGFWLAQLMLMDKRERSEDELVEAVGEGLKQFDAIILLDLPSDEQVRAYYEAHREEFGKPSVHLRTVFVSRDETARESMEELRAELAADGDFAAAAKEHSTDWAAEKGGDRGWVSKGDLREDLQQAAFGLESGQVSKLIEDDTHYWILKVDERREVTPLEAVRFSVVTAIEEEQRVEKIKAWLAEARQDLERESRDPPRKAGVTPGQTPKAPTARRRQRNE
jgi:tetratricopeptide (TPR) repeat protein